MVIILMGCGSSAPPGGMPGMDGGPGADARAADPSIVMPTDGSRIKAHWAETAEGQRIFVGWYDTMLKTDCSFRRAVDGESRCLPFGFLLATPAVDYADGACTTPAAVFSYASCEPPAFMRRLDTTNSCETRERVYARGERIPDGVTYWRPDGPMGQCTAGGILDTSAAFRLGPELPVSMFVKGKNGTPVAGGPLLDVVPFEIEDGARGYAWLHGRTGAQCTFWPLDDGRLHCFPATASLSTVTFADAMCAQGAGFFMPACGAAPEVLLRPNRGTCPLTYAPLALDARVDTVYRVTNGACGPVPIPIGNEYHAVGGPAPVDGFPAIDYLNEESAGRLRRRLSPVAGGRKVLAGFYDSTRQETCELFSFGPGKFRCAPPAARLTFYYADARCTQPLLALASDACPPKYAYRYDNSVCPARARFYTVGAAFTGQSYAQTNLRGDTGATLECRATTAALTPAGQTLYATTDVPEDQLAEIKRIDPM